MKDGRDYPTACSSGTSDRLLYTVSKREEGHSLATIPCTLQQRR